MSLYTRRQILVLLTLLAIAGLGLAVGHWRRARPDLADRLEQLDRAPAPSSSLPPQSDAGTATEPSSSEPEPRRAPRGKAPPRTATPRDSPADALSRPIDAPGPAIDVNRATALELTRLPGIGPALARRIVDARDADGRFARVDELGRVRGISARKVEQLRAFVTIAE
jgi:competence ComEA-like helix-hairpin-helix protein